MFTHGPSMSSPFSSSSTPRWKFDVFICFRGEDTRTTFANLLYTALKKKGVLTFQFDSGSERGKLIAKEIFEAIEESRFGIVIFSRNFAYSAFCLDELARIIRCKEETGMTVLPVFYDVDPSDVWYQRGTFAPAFAEHEKGYKDNTEKVETWRAALKEAANLSGWDVRDGSVSESIKRIVENILHHLRSSLSVTRELVGIDSSMEELITSYEALRNNVCMIGICGMGGSGKTTLAKVVYEILRDHFEGCSFIANVREYSEKLDLLQLQQLLLADILEERNIEIRNVYHGVNMIKTRLCHKKVLIVLDDVNKLDQLENLAGEHGWFGPGSLIIITTRDEHLLVHHGVHKICKPNPLNSDDALRLFCLKAFKNEQPKEGYLQLSQDAVRYANGYPLALITFGSFLFGRTMDMWKSALDGFKKIPKKEIFDTLKVSYDGLEEMWKDIFLDVACFFRGKRKDEVIEILETCGFDAKIGIQVLMDNSLLTIENNKLQMHVLLEEMGMEIVRRESREEPGKRSRLWLRKDLFHVLMNNTASKTIQAIVLDSIGGDEAYQHIESYSKVFSKMCNLRLLIIDNVHILNGLNHLSNELRFLEWHGYSSKCLPSRFQSKELVELKLRFSKIEYLWRGVKYLDKLKLINLEHSINLNETPDFTGVPRLEILCLSRCINLVKIHPSIGQLSKLTVLNLESCLSLINLPSTMDGLRSLEKFILSGCSKLSNLPENLGKIKCLKELDLTGTAIREVPSSISFLIRRGCENKIFKARLDSVHLEFENSAVVKATKVMRTYDDSNEAECSASWSFPEEIEREEGSEGQIKLEPQGAVFEDEAVEVTSNSSEQMEFVGEEIGNEASQRQPEFIQDEELERAISTLEPQGEVFDVEALKMPRSSRQIEFQIKDNEMEHEADRPEEARLFLMQGGLGLTEPPKDEDWENAKVMNLMDNELSVLPENPRCPKLSALFLKRNYKLRIIPPSFFDYMPALQILNLSRTGIKSLPDSIIRLVNLKRLFLNDCHCFMMLSPKVGELKQLEVLDLEGTEIMDLPQEVKKLTNLSCLEVSFCEYMSDGKPAMQSNAVVPCGVISELSQLEELNIDVNPEDERWDAHLENIVNEVCVLNRLETLKFYFPRVDLLRQFLCNIPLPSHFRFTVGHHVKRIISRVPPDVEFELERWERCLIYINGEVVPGDIKKVLQHATAFFLDRHAAVKKVSNFGIRNMMQLKCLVMGECNEVQVIIDEADFFEEDDIGKIVSDSYATEKIVLGSLEYLYIYYMKSLRSIWEGSVQQNSLVLLRSLTLCTCPQLTIVFTQGLLANLCKLEELKVKDCPSVNSIVSCKTFSEDRTSYFLPNLKKISLHYMTGLVSISSGLQIAPKLEWLSFYDCPKLKNPLIDEISSQDLKKIKGERIWWEALEWSNGCPDYLDKIFVPIDDIWDC